MDAQSEAAAVDQGLLERVSDLPPGGQRWLRTALQAIKSSGLLDDGLPSPARREATPADEEPEPRAAPASLEDVITGKADLREHLESYPELADELNGLAEIIDLLRDSGEARRRKGEQILREEILGEPGRAPEDEESS